MGCGCECGGNPHRQALGRRHVLWTVRSAGMRVAEAQCAQHLVAADDRDDERGRGRQFPVQSGGGAAAGTVVVTVDPGAQRRLARSHDERDGAGEVVAPDAGAGDQRTHVAGELTDTMRGSDAAKCARGGNMDKTEVREPGEGLPSRALERALMCHVCGHSQSHRVVQPLHRM
jgi:hypothetical protein